MPRSTEIQPSFCRFVNQIQIILLFSVSYELPGDLEKFFRVLRTRNSDGWSIIEERAEGGGGSERAIEPVKERKGREIKKQRGKGKRNEDHRVLCSLSFFPFCLIFFHPFISPLTLSLPLSSLSLSLFIISLKSYELPGDFEIFSKLAVTRNSN